jgi:hypothetical protein
MKYKLRRTAREAEETIRSKHNVAHTQLRFSVMENQAQRLRHLSLTCMFPFLLVYTFPLSDQIGCMECCCFYCKQNDEVTTVVSFICLANARHNYLYSSILTSD